MSGALPPAHLPPCRLQRINGDSVEITGNLSLGRGNFNDLVLSSGKASRKHASLQMQNGGEIWLIDLGSANGTFVNGRRAFQPMRLQDGDNIAIAGEDFIFRQELPAETDLTNGLATVLTVPQVQSRRCWLLLADIEGFTPLSQRLEPQELAVTVGKWIRESREIVDKYGGKVDKYLGDGYLAFWLDGPEIPAKVVAALQENRASQATNALPFRLVLHVGSVVFGAGASFSEESMMGPEVNFIFRMEKVAGGVQAKVLLSEPARTALEPLLACEPVEGEHELKGFVGGRRFYVPAGA